jgi:hypothetical protein
MYGQHTDVFFAMPFLIATQSEQSQLLSSVVACDQKDQVSHVIFTMRVGFQRPVLVAATWQPYWVTSVQRIVEKDVELIRIHDTLSLVTYALWCFNGE